MAHIYAGADRRMIDQEVLDAFKHLPDDFWIFAEFTIDRNIDWFVVRLTPQGTGMLTAIELKRTATPFRGDLNSSWEQLSALGEWKPIALTGAYRNYYWQAVQAAGALRDWLYNNQQRYTEGTDLHPPEAFKIWPDLLILSPPGTIHELPLYPSNKFGTLLYALEDCTRHLLSWRSRVPLVPLSEAELAKLAGVLGLERIWPEAAPAVAPPGDAPPPLARLRELEERVRLLEERAGLAPALPSPGAPPAPPSADTVFGWIEDCLREVGDGRFVPFTTLGHRLNQRHQFTAERCNTTLTELLRRAEAAGHVRLAVIDGVPHAALPGATAPGSPASGPAPPPRQLDANLIRAAVRVIAAAEDRAAGRVVQAESLVKHLRETPAFGDERALTDADANRLLAADFVRFGYVEPVTGKDLDPDTGELRDAIAGYRLNREHASVRYILRSGAVDLKPGLEVRALDPDAGPLRGAAS